MVKGLISKKKQSIINRNSLDTRAIVLSKKEAVEVGTRNQYLILNSSLTNHSDHDSEIKIEIETESKLLNCDFDYDWKREKEINTEVVRKNEDYQLSVQSNDYHFDEGQGQGHVEVSNVNVNVTNDGIISIERGTTPTSTSSLNQAMNFNSESASTQRKPYDLSVFGERGIFGPTGFLASVASVASIASTINRNNILPSSSTASASTSKSTSSSRFPFNLNPSISINRNLSTKPLRVDFHQKQSTVRVQTQKAIMNVASSNKDEDKFENYKENDREKTKRCRFLGIGIGNVKEVDIGAGVGGGLSYWPRLTGVKRLWRTFTGWSTSSWTPSRTSNYRKMRKVLEKRDVPSNELALSIDIVLKALFRNLDVDQLKTARLVSRRWNELATPEIQKRVSIDFRYKHNEINAGPYYEYFGGRMIWMWNSSSYVLLSCPLRLGNLLRHMRTSENFPCTSFNFLCLDSQDRKKNVQLTSSPCLQHFLNEHGSTLKQLSLHLSYVESGLDSERLFVKDMRTLLLHQTPNLQSLKLRIRMSPEWLLATRNQRRWNWNRNQYFSYADSDVIEAIPQDFFLHSLKLVEMTEDVPEGFFQEIIRLAPNLQEFNVEALYVPLLTKPICLRNGNGNGFFAGSHSKTKSKAVQKNLRKKGNLLHVLKSLEISVSPHMEINRSEYFEMLVILSQVDNLSLRKLRVEFTHGRKKDQDQAQDSIKGQMEGQGKGNFSKYDLPEVIWDLMYKSSTTLENLTLIWRKGKAAMWNNRFSSLIIKEDPFFLILQNLKYLTIKSVNCQIPQQFFPPGLVLPMVCPILHTIILMDGRNPNIKFRRPSKGHVGEFVPSLSVKIVKIRRGSPFQVPQKYPKEYFHQIETMFPNAIITQE